jgi:colanic acid/amylovoran biosynthesis glycosyltransferase
MRILYVTTTFPVYSETFLQREVRALKALGADLSIVSLHRGDLEFENLKIDRFQKRELFQLIWLFPWLMVSKPSLFWKHWKALFSRAPRSWLNFWENLLGLGAAIVRERSLLMGKPDVIHCVWSSAPAAFGWLLASLADRPFSIGAHAYDVFEKGGDWLLPAKAAHAAFVHTSTESARLVLSQLVEANKIRVIRRGLNVFPEFGTLRKDRSCLRLICVARLVEKKGLPYQLDIYEALRESGIEFQAKIVGEGPLRNTLSREIEARGLAERLQLLGQLSMKETLSQIAWGDALIHTGIVARSGDRDGLPNVIPEAMASGTIVVASPVSGVIEAVVDGENGFLARVENVSDWVYRLKRIQNDDALCQKLRKAGREWVESEFSAQKNSGKLYELLVKASSS